MAKEREGLGEYVRQVRESTQRYAKDLLNENEKLLSLASTLHAEKVRLEEQLESTQAAALENAALRAALEALRDERTRLTQQLEGARYQVERQRMFESALMEQLAQMEGANRDFSKRYVEVEQANSNLANLYVASYRIHGSLTREHVTETIHEVLVNLIGSEAFAIYERRAEGEELVLTSSLGLDVGPPGWLERPPARVAEVVRTGQAHVKPADAGGEEPLVACIPLRVGADIRGAIAVVRLLSHKPALEPGDHELFDLLATHAATALYCCDLHARGRAGDEAA